nr:MULTISPECIES: phospholipid carrier-dependent glycosyltransferase [Microbacterium]
MPAPGSFVDRWRERYAADPVLRRRYRWLVPTLITLLAAALRVWNLGHPHTLVFDETYYVKDAWSQWNLGFAAAWPEGANELFAAGDTDIFLTEPSFVVHPPLGKYLIGAGMAIFGADSSFGWRIAAALAGTACVLVLYVLAKALTNSVAFAGVAAFLLAIDGIGIVLSRVALLDIFLTFFVLLAVWFMVLDRRRHLDRLAARVVALDGEPPRWGPVLWNRPWVIAAGAAAGAATAVKWSGVWVIAAIGIYLAVTDALERRRLGITMWPMDAVRQGLASFVLLVPVAFVVYLASWTGWLVTDDGYGRHKTDNALTSLWEYHITIYNSMATMDTPHGYMSPAWAWPFLWRPTSMHAASTADGEAGCASASGCLDVIYSMPNPLLWYAGVAATIWLAYRFVVARDWRHAVVLTGIAATWLPWLIFPERTTFQFYTVVLMPFLLLALTFALREVSGARHAPPERRLTGQRVVGVFLVFAVLLSAFWYPLWSGMQVPYEFYRMHNWLTGWV